MIRDFRSISLTTDKSTVFSLPEELTMSTMIGWRLGACAIGFASLIATSGPALAAVTISCKNPVQVSGGILAGTSQARSHAKTKWVQAATNKYGSVWAKYTKAKNKHYTCKKVKGGTTCKLSAQPCRQVGTPRDSNDGSSRGRDY